MFASSDGVSSFECFVSEQLYSAFNLNCVDCFCAVTMKAMACWVTRRAMQSWMVSWSLCSCRLLEAVINGASHLLPVPQVEVDNLKSTSSPQETCKFCFRVCTSVPAYVAELDEKSCCTPNVKLQSARSRVTIYLPYSDLSWWTRDYYFSIQTDDILSRRREDIDIVP